MADTVDKQVPHNAPASEQVTSKTPATLQKKPKRVAAGKAIADKTKKAREEQSIIAQVKLSDDPPAPPPETTKNVLTTTQWLSIISIAVSLAGVYYKREEVKKTVLPRAHPRLQRESDTWLEHFIMNPAQASLKAAAN